MSVSLVAVLESCLCVLWVVGAGVAASHCGSSDTQDPCHPHLPCELNSRISYPENCEQYRKCVAPYQWLVTNSECGGTKGVYSNITCYCLQGNMCDTWECPPPQGTESPLPDSEPCFTQPSDVMCVEGNTLADRYYCTNYFRCKQGIWERFPCLKDQPFYDVSLANEQYPCSSNMARCQSIPFDQCQTKFSTASFTDPTTTELCVTIQTTTQPPLSTFNPITTTQGETTARVTSEHTTLRDLVTTTRYRSTSNLPTTEQTTSDPPSTTRTPEQTTPQTTVESTTAAFTRTTMATTTSAYTCPLEPDACYPHMPCTTKSRVSNPEDCGSFLQCAAPHEWRLIEDECGGSYGSFSNQTCSCGINNECDTWECGPPTGTIPPPLGTGPCFLDPETTCQTAYQTLPDRNYCTKYYECDDGEWISKSCPSADAPYYDMTIPFVNPPCRYDINKCDLIPFDECLPVTTPPPV